MSDENVTLPGGFSERQIRLLWVYLPVFVILGQSFVIWKMGQIIADDKVTAKEMFESQLKEKNAIIKQQDELLKNYDGAYNRLSNIMRNGKIVSVDSDSL